MSRYYGWTFLNNATPESSTKYPNKLAEHFAKDHHVEGKEVIRHGILSYGADRTS